MEENVLRHSQASQICINNFIFGANSKNHIF